MEGMPEPVGPYTPPMDLIPVGTGEYKMYIVLAKQPRKFDNEVADGGLTLQRMKDEKILTGEATWGFDFSRLVEVKSLQVVKAQFFQYESKFPLQFFYNGGTEEIQFMHTLEELFRERLHDMGLLSSNGSSCRLAPPTMGR